MSHTYWDPKGMVKRRPGGFTYYGGNTKLSDQYKERYLPHYDKNTKMSSADRDADDEVSLKHSAEFNTYQKRTWYQDNLDRTTKPEFADFPGTHAEWRKAGDFEKSLQNYNANVVYDYAVNVTTTNADGVASTQQMRTTDHTQVTKFRKEMEEKDRYDIQDRDIVLDRPNTSNNAPSQSSNGQNPGPRPNTGLRHPAINPGLCRQHPKDTFRNSNRQNIPLFGTTGRK